MICHNGGLICNPNSGVVKYQRNICDAENILKFLLEYKIKYKIDNIVLSRCNETYLLTHANKYLHSIIVNEELPYFYVGKQMAHIHDIQRIIISVASQYRQFLESEIVRLFNHVIVCGWRGRDDIVDISVAHVDKWKAVKHIAAENAVCVDNIISFGDAYNDIELLKNSGIGVCMINGVKEAKDVADYVTDYDNNEDGVYCFLTKQLSAIFRL